MSKRKAAGEPASQPKQEVAPKAPETSSLPKEVYRTETILVTPTVAKEWLGRNFERNRTLNQSAVSRFVATMLAGKWDYSPQPIVFKGNTLIDGQHRLTSLVLAGDEKADIAIPMLVAYGPDSMSVNGIDRGTTRSHGHVLELNGLAERGMGKKISTYIRALLALSMNQSEPGGFESVAEDIMKKSGEDIMSSYDSVQYKHAIAPNIAGIAYAMPVDPVGIKRMLLSVKLNDGLTKDTGPWHLRRIFDGDVRSCNGGERDVRLYRSLMILKCIHMYLKGKSVGELKVVTSFDAKPIDPEPLAFFRKEREKCGVGELVFL